MSKFLTPPVWYDKNGNLNEMLTGKAVTSRDIAIGSGTSAAGGGVAINGGSTGGGVAINGTSMDGAVAINGTATGGGIAIGSGTLTTRGGIAIGAGASAADNQIQLGKNDTAYTLNVGDGTGTINGVKLSASELSESNAVIQLGQNNTAYTLNVGNGNSVTSGYIENGISYPDNDSKYGFVDVSYSQDGNYVKKDVQGGIYIVRVQNNTVGHKTLCTFLFEIDGKKTEYSSMFEYDGGTELKHAVIKAIPDGTGTVTLSVVDSVEYGTGPIREYTNFTISVRCISKRYAVG